MQDDSKQMRRIQRALDRQERFPWLLITKSFRTATSAQVLLLAVIGSLATSAGWRLADGVVLQSANKLEHARLDYDSQYFGKWPGQRSSAVFPWRCNGTEEMMNWLGYPPDDPICTVPYRIVAPAVGILSCAGASRALVYYLLGGLWTIVVWAGFGCAITRIAVRRYTRDDRISLGEAMQFSRRRIASHLGGVLGPLVGAFVFAIPVVLLGLLMRTGPGAAISGLLWLFVVPLALVMSIILLLSLFSWPLIWGAIAAEASDAFDAISRAYSYTLQRPLHYLAYAVFAALIGVLGWIVVWLLSEIMAHMGLWTAAVGAGADRVSEILAAASPDTETTGTLRFSAYFITFWNGLIRTFASSYAYSFFWCATAAAYLLLRQQVDGVELDEVVSDETEIERFGLPELNSHADGIPHAVDAGESAAAESDEPGSS